MTIDEAKQKLTECTQLKIDFEYAISSVQNSQYRAMNRMAELTNELPGALAQRALEKENEVDRIKKEMAECDEILKDAPLTMEELTRMQAANDERIKESQGVIEKHEHQLKYEALKEEILSNTYSEGQIEAKILKLKAIAHSIDHNGSIQRDYEGFVDQIQSLYKTYRIAR